MSDRNAVPVLMYHSVGRRLGDWGAAELTTPVDIFEDHLKWLEKRRFQTINLQQLYDSVAHKSPLPERSIVLSFDDGYVDNWTYVVPLLNRYGFSATIAVNPDFIDPRDIVRPTLEDVWSGRIRENELEVRGFVSWSELKLASKRNLLSVQSHSMTHTWYPTGSQVIDFHHPGDSYYWLDWNDYPEDKPFFLRHPTQSKVPWGTPVYVNDRSLGITRYFPDQREVRSMCEFVLHQGGERFFEQAKWRQTLFAELTRYREENGVAGRYETDEERLGRFRAELVVAKQLIEEKIETEAGFLFWPGGVRNSESMALADSIYKASPVGEPERRYLKNRPGDDASKISRRGAPTIEQDGRVLYLGGRYLVKYLDEFCEIPFARRQRQFLKLLFLIGARLKLWPR